MPTKSKQDALTAMGDRGDSRLSDRWENCPVALA